MARFAIGDLFIDLEVPAHLQAAYSDSGVLVLEDRADPVYLIELSAFTVTPQDPTERNACVKFNRQRASDAGKILVEVAPDHVYWQDSSTTTEDGEPSTCLHWRVGFGNRAPLVSLSFRDADADQLDRRTLATIVDSIVRSIRRTHEDLAPVTGPPIVRDLAPSQEPWLEAQRARLIERLDAPPTLALLDEAWGAFVGEASTDDTELDAIINEVGVALGDELARSRHAFAWTVVTDAYGTAIAVVALRDTAKVIIDPFNFVAKRWDSRMPAFLVDCVGRILTDVDRIAW